MRHQTLLIVLFLAAMTMAAFWPVQGHEFVTLDDSAYVVQNPRVTNGLTWSGVRWAFNIGYVGNWHPLTWLSHMVDCELFGVDSGRHHLMNAGLHALNTGLVFLLLWQLTGWRWPCLIAAAFFGLHPLRVESVAWVSERKDVLSAFFGLMALCLYVGYARRPGLGRYALILIFFTLSLMSKPMLVTLPCVMVLLDVWPLRRLRTTLAGGTFVDPTPEGQSASQWWLALEKIPLLALAGGASVLAYQAQRFASAVGSTDFYPLSLRLANATISYARYLGKTVWPVDLAAIYPYPAKWPAAEVAAAGGLLFAITAIAFVYRRRHPSLLIGWLWFVGTLVPVIGLVQVGVQSMADRYSYFPSIGLALVIAGIIGLVPNRWFYRVALPASAVGLLLLTMQLRAQTAVWRDTHSLLSQTLDVTKDNWYAHYAMGDLRARRGEVDQARAEYAESLRLRPDYPRVWCAIGNLEIGQGRVDEAIAAFRRTVELDPDFKEALNNLAWLLSTQPEARRRDGVRAVELAERACDLTKRQEPPYLGTLAAAYAEAGRFDLAVQTAEQARDLAQQLGDEAVVAEMRASLELYRLSRPMRQAIGVD